jgi:hypothetical protein
VHIGSFLYQATSYETELGDVFVDLYPRQLEVMAVVTLSTQQTKELVEEGKVVDRDWEFDVAAMTRAAVYS